MRPLRSTATPCGSVRLASVAGLAVSRKTGLPVAGYGPDDAVAESNLSYAVVSRVRNVEIAGGIEGKPPRIGELRRDGRTAVSGEADHPPIARQNADDAGFGGDGAHPVIEGSREEQVAGGVDGQAPNKTIRTAMAAHYRRLSVPPRRLG